MFADDAHDVSCNCSSRCFSARAGQSGAVAPLPARARRTARPSLRCGAKALSDTAPRT
ncbi:hypothetical protein BSIN_2990 [Burkholderia singularis]|uniref:Uncharacterized protein n=1 Tax=Burkholderia singularis TaxID=1503053 RepID=A0A238H3E5_9BURK|nr:hypothetical protein BSIN_2990 [Burkholderia singularis]